MDKQVVLYENLEKWMKFTPKQVSLAREAESFLEDLAISFKEKFDKMYDPDQQIAIIYTLESFYNENKEWFDRLPFDRKD
jgi:hypothetical protein